MLNLIRADFYKLNKALSLKICFLLSCASASSLVYISHCIAVGSMGEEVSQSASGLTEIVIVSLLGSLMAGILICTDFETKSIHDSIASGNGRLAIIISKAVVYVLIIALLLLPYAISVIVGACTGASFTAPFVASMFLGILSEASADSVTAGTIAKMLVISLVTAIVDAARLSICIPMSFKLRKPVAILAIGFVFNALIDLIVGLLIKIPVFKAMISFTPFTRNFLLMTMETGTGTLAKAVICSILFITIIVALTYAAFRKAEIK